MAAVIVCCSLPPPPVIVAVTVMEYSVPSSRPVSVYILSLPGIPGIMVVETGEQSVSTLEYEIVYDAAVKLCSSAHEMIRDVVDKRLTDTLSPSSKSRGK